MEDFVAKTSATINAPLAKVWDAFVNPIVIKQYMFGTDVVSDWKAGSAITWTGEWQGKSYKDKGQIKKIEPEKLLEYNHFSPMEGKPDVPENYHTVTIELSETGGQTEVRLSQDHNPTEESRADSQKNWEMMLEGLKKLLEK